MFIHIYVFWPTDLLTISPRLFRPKYLFVSIYFSAVFLFSFSIYLYSMNYAIALNALTVLIFTVTSKGGKLC